jgi:hypothetical protein
MTRLALSLCAALFFSPVALAADAAAADACTCKDQGHKCEGCCSACSKDGKGAKDGACACKDDHCKSCPVCGKKKAK